jgi:hypothetical protein|tara:strand:- start:82 stop:528 length:447 start_codon:yes stop_codon:yes gene_type:complete
MKPTPDVPVALSTRPAVAEANKGAPSAESLLIKHRILLPESATHPKEPDAIAVCAKATALPFAEALSRVKGATVLSTVNDKTSYCATVDNALVYMKTEFPSHFTVCPRSNALSAVVAIVSVSLTPRVPSIALVGFDPTAIAILLLVRL